MHVMVLALYIILSIIDINDVVHNSTLHAFFMERYRESCHLLNYIFYGNQRFITVLCTLFHGTYDANKQIDMKIEIFSLGVLYV